MAEYEVSEKRYGEGHDIGVLTRSPHRVFKFKVIVMSILFSTEGQTHHRASPTVNAHSRSLFRSQARYGNITFPVI